MHPSRPIIVDATKILTRRELAMVLADLHAKSPRSKNAALNLILVRLACCCGLRVSEIVGLQIADVRCELSRPHLRIRRGASKGGRPRMVPLWWDAAGSRRLEGRAHRSWRRLRLAVRGNTSPKTPPPNSFPLYDVSNSPSDILTKPPSLGALRKALDSIAGQAAASSAAQ
ncbi:MAG: site-specific integrase [Planctomycetaceae bacterium]|nr:site-specific integrase [Planctomycetaceae bacterium]